jgi:hypothetical protein
MTTFCIAFYNESYLSTAMSLEFYKLYILPPLYSGKTFIVFSSWSQALDCINGLNDVENVRLLLYRSCIALFIERGCLSKTEIGE